MIERILPTATGYVKRWEGIKKVSLDSFFFNFMWPLQTTIAGTLRKNARDEQNGPLRCCQRRETVELTKSYAEKSTFQPVKWMSSIFKWLYFIRRYGGMVYFCIRQ